VPIAPCSAESYSRFQASVRRTASALGLRRQGSYRLADLNVPDSEIGKKATSLVTKLAPSFLVNHSIRTYLFAAALGLRDSTRFNREVSISAAIMHDLGLTAHFNSRDGFELQRRCFCAFTDFRIQQAACSLRKWTISPQTRLTGRFLKQRSRQEVRAKEWPPWGNLQFRRPRNQCIRG